MAKQMIALSREITSGVIESTECLTHTIIGTFSASVVRKSFRGVQYCEGSIICQDGSRVKLIFSLPMIENMKNMVSLGMLKSDSTRWLVKSFVGHNGSLMNMVFGVQQDKKCEVFEPSMNLPIGTTWEDGVCACSK